MSEAGGGVEADYYRQRFGALFARRCVVDRWSEEAKRCWLVSRHGGHDCDELLTARQHDMLECIDDAAVTTGKPPTAPADIARIDKACEDERKLEDQGLEPALP